MNPSVEDPKNIEEILDNKKYAFLNEVSEQIQENTKNIDKIDGVDSGKTWQELQLPEGLIEVLQMKGFKKPSKVQANIISLTNKKMSVIGQSQNGSGKTLSFLIPCLIALDPKQKGQDGFGNPAPQIIIVGDTKALILQIHRLMRDLLDSYPDFEKITTDYLFGGKTQIEKDVGVLFTTLHQLKKVLLKKEIKTDNLKILVIDEADSVFGSDFGRNTAKILFSKLLKNLEYKFIMVSATFTEDFKNTIKDIQKDKNYIKFDLPVESLTLKNVYQFMISYSNYEQKDQVLKVLIEQLDVQNILIFGNNKKRLESLQKFLEQNDHKVAFIYKSSNSLQDQGEFLEKQTKDFLAGKYRILLTTNLLSRGIDMRKVTLVINYELPLKFYDKKEDFKREVDTEIYLHRVGRTGRFGDEGIAINLVHKQKDENLVQQLLSFYKESKIKELDADSFKQLNDILKQIQNKNQQKREVLEENI